MKTTNYQYSCVLYRAKPRTAKLILLFFLFISIRPFTSFSQDGSAGNPFTYMEQARTITGSGIYYFNIGGTSFSTYVSNGWLLVVTDSSHTAGVLPQTNSLSNAQRGLLSPAVLATLNRTSELKVATSDGNVNDTSNNPTLISRLTHDSSMNLGVNDIGINSSWAGSGIYSTNVKGANANSNAAPLGAHLETTVFWPGGDGSGFHWVPNPSYAYHREDYAIGEAPIGTSFTLWAEAPLLTIALNGINGTCTGNSSITATVSGNNGIPNYELLQGTTVIRNYQASNVFSNLPDGTYTVQAQDANTLLTVQSSPITVTSSYVPMSISVVNDTVFCTSPAAGVLSANVTNGTTPYSYSITAGPVTAAAQSSNSFSGLPVGNYTISVTDSCGNTVTNNAAVVLATGILASASDSDLCEGSSVLLSINENGANSYSWTGPDGFTSSAQNPTINYLSSAATGTYTVTVTNSVCVNNYSVTITVNNLPTASISYSNASFCASGTVSPTVIGTIGGSFSAPTGLSIDPSTGDINLSNSTPGMYTVTYTFSSSSTGCSNTASTFITVNPLPMVITQPQTVCAPSVVDLTNSAVVAGSSPGLSFTYYVDTLGTQVVSNPSSINVSGAYYIQGTNSYGCSSTTPLTVTINPLPSIQVTNPSVCYPNTIDLTAASITAGSSSGLMFSYFTNSAVTNILSNPNAISVSGTYYIKGSNTLTGCSKVDSVVVTINPLPNLVISNPSPVCSPSTIDLTAASITAGSSSGLVFTYYTDAAGTQVLSNPNAVAVSGNYYIVGTSSSGCNSVIGPVMVTIIPLPTLMINNPSPVCTPSTIDITSASVTAGSSSGLSFSYYTDAAGTQVLSNPNAISSSGTYYIKGTNSNGCSTISPVTVTIDPLPNLVITNPSPVCTPSTIDLTALAITNGSSSGLSFTYYKDAGGTQVLTNPNAISTSGTYYLKGTNSNGCSTISPVTVTINPLPTLVITNPSAVCAPSTIDLTAASITSGSSSGLSLTYYTDAAGTQILSNPNAVSSSGTYYIKGTNGNGCNSVISPVTVTINPQPTMVITNPASVCAASTIDIAVASITAGSSSGLSFSYYTDAAGTQLLPNPNDISASGTYYIKGTNVNGCSTISPVTVMINPLPNLVINNPTGVCAPNTVDISNATVTSGSSSGLTFSYYLDAAGTQVVPNPSAISSNGTYYIKAINSNGCSKIAPVTVSINTQPTLVITDPATVCAPTTVDLTSSTVTNGSTPNISFNYYTDAGGTQILNNPNAINVSGTYYIKGNSNSGCSSPLMSVTVNISPQPMISVSSDTLICKGGSVTLTAQSMGNTINWTSLGAGNSITVSPDTSTTYHVVATNSFGCTNTASVEVQVQNFVLSLSANPSPALAGNTVELTTSASVNYQVLAWEPLSYFSNQTATSQSFIAVDSVSTYTVIAKSALGCLDTVTLVENIEPNTKDFFIPNAFSPNGDGLNDIFKVYGESIKELHMMIFNQWGQLLYENADPQAGWDGMYKGVQQPVGVYIYVVKALLYSGVTYSKRGPLNLIR